VQSIIIITTIILVVTIIIIIITIIIIIIITIITILILIPQILKAVVDWKNRNVPSLGPALWQGTAAPLGKETATEAPSRASRGIFPVRIVVVCVIVHIAVSILQSARKGYPKLILQVGVLFTGC